MKIIYNDKLILLLSNYSGRHLPGRIDLQERMQQTIDKMIKFFIIVLLVTPIACQFLLPCTELVKWLMHPRTYKFERQFPIEFM